jgi:hypothetical protein
MPSESGTVRNWPDVWMIHGSMMTKLGACESTLPVASNQYWRYGKLRCALTGIETQEEETVNSVL